MGTTNYNIEQVIRYIQDMKPGQAKLIAAMAQARLTAIGEAVDSNAFLTEGRNPSTYTVSGSTRNVQLAINGMTHPDDTANLQRIEAVATRLAGLDTDESSSSSSSLSSLSSSSSSSDSSSSSSQS